jgi:hypothetical protein
VNAANPEAVSGNPRRSPETPAALEMPHKHSRLGGCRQQKPVEAGSASTGELDPVLCVKSAITMTTAQLQDRDHDRYGSPEETPVGGAAFHAIL